jgi:hypothetical protein
LQGHRTSGRCLRSAMQEACNYALIPPCPPIQARRCQRFVFAEKLLWQICGPRLVPLSSPVARTCPFVGSEYQGWCDHAASPALRCWQANKSKLKHEMAKCWLKNSTDNMD